MVERIGFWRRLASLAVDNILTVGAAFCIGIFWPSDVSGAIASESAPGKEAADEAVATIGSILEILSAGFFALLVMIMLIFLLEGITGYSPGKLIFGFRIRDQFGGRAPLWDLLLRSVIKSSGPVILVLGTIAEIGFIWRSGLFIIALLYMGCFLALGNRKLALHDRLAETAVYHKSHRS